MCKSKFEEYFLELYKERISFFSLNYRDMRNSWETLKDRLLENKCDRTLAYAIDTFEGVMIRILSFFERYQEDCMRVRIGDEEYFKRRFEELGCCSKCHFCNQNETT